MKGSENEPNLNKEKIFRELQPVEFWGANIDVGSDPSTFKQALIEAAKQSSKNYFGYFVYSEDKANVYHLSRYPRRKYGPIPDDEALRKQLKTLLDISKQVGKEEAALPEPQFRIVFGLEQGYGTGKFFTRQDVVSILGTKFNLTPAEIFTVRVVDSEPSTYQEPALVIQGLNRDIRAVYELAEKLGQERFAVEDLGNHTSHIVETRLCSNPDAE